MNIHRFYKIIVNKKKSKKQKLSVEGFRNYGRILKNRSCSPTKVYNFY